METRLRLRRRLLRINDDACSSSSASLSLQFEDRDPSPLPVSQALRKSILGQSQKELKTPQEEENNDQNNNDDEENDDEDGDDEEMDEDDGDFDDEELTATDLQRKTKPSEKCETAGVIKLLFSHRDLSRNPTVWFDYPPHLSVTRSHSLPSSTAGGINLVVVNAQDCPLFYKTHWERNCVKNAFAVAGLRRTKKQWSEWHIAWAKHIPRTKFKYFRQDMPQVFNHFPDPWVLGRKDRLLKTLTMYKRRFGQAYNFFPEGFNLPEQRDALLRAIQRDEALTSASSASKSLWIVKPPASACGRGIRVISSKDIDSSVSKTKKYVVQRYLANPLLMDGFKFDLRVYVLVTSVDPLRIYMFQEGITRFCTTKYSLSNLRNRFSHLTNYSINKKNNKFVENANALEENVGSKWSMTALFDHLEATNIISDSKKLKQQIRDIISKTIIAAEAHLTPLSYQFVKKPTTCYELFGFDLMIDANLTPCLIEVNVSPSLMGGSPLDKRVKGLLLSDIFHLVGVQVPLTSIPPEALPHELHQCQQQTPPTLFPSTKPSKKPIVGIARRRYTLESSLTTPLSRINNNKQLHEVVLDPSIPYFQNSHIEMFTASDWAIIHQMEDEMDRLGHFERLYPCANAEDTTKYAPYFTCQRYANALCAKWIQTCNTVAQRTRKKMKPYTCK